MTSAIESTPLALVPVAPHGRFAGFGTLLRKELSGWWRTRLWWIQMLVWLVLLAGVGIIASLDADLGAAAARDEAVQTFLLVSATAVGIGVVLTLQGAIIGEVELGTAAWVMSKPASRTSFILAKAAAHGFGLLVTSVVVPAGVFLLATSAVLTEPVLAGPLLAGLAIVGLGTAYWIALTLLLGARFGGRGPVAGIGVGMLLAGLFFSSMLPPFIVDATPWRLGHIATSVALGDGLASGDWVPLVTTALSIVVFLLLAVRRFGREEF